MVEKVTKMVLKVDLQCCRCYKKVKKILCKFPQIQDQIYDEKANTVTITVVCCSPEKIRDKICCMGGGSIKCIKIILPPPPPPPPPSQPPPPSPPPPPPSPPPPPPPSPPPPPPPCHCPIGCCCMECCHGHGGCPCHFGGAQPYPQIGFCCMECYHGHDGGPCHFGGAPPPPCYVTYGRPVYDSWGGGGSGYKYRYVSRGDCFSEENPQACSIM